MTRLYPTLVLDFNTKLVLFIVAGLQSEILNGHIRSRIYI